MTLDPMPLPDKAFKKITRELELSAQQTKVVSYVLRGLTDKEIAERMSLKLPTIRSHLGRIFERGKVDNRLKLVLKIFAMSHNIAT
ncbi:MAG: helix-turn-helix transcriptional regulator [Planctomycetales bacterium]|nr:helix-turn-helix transcriptional regulator [Planctomycetales bacterium]